MDKRILIGIVVVAVILALIIWGLVIPNFRGDNNSSNGPQIENATPSALIDLELPESSQAVFGTSVLMSRTHVKKIINENVFWIGPLNEERDLIVVFDDEINLKEGNAVSVSGEIKSFSEIANQSSDWNLSSEDVAIIRDNPVYIRGENVEILN